MSQFSPFGVSVVIPLGWLPFECGRLVSARQGCTIPPCIRIPPHTHPSNTHTPHTEHRRWGILTSLHSWRSIQQCPQEFHPTSPEEGEEVRMKKCCNTALYSHTAPHTSLTHTRSTDVGASSVRCTPGDPSNGVSTRVPSNIPREG